MSREPARDPVIGARTRLLREALGLTQRQVAAAAGMNPRVLGAIERGVRSPQPATVTRIAAGLGISEDLLDPEVARPAADQVIDALRSRGAGPGGPLPGRRQGRRDES